MLFGDLITGGHVKVDVKDGKAVFEVTAAKVAPKKTDDDAEDDTTVEDESPKEPVNVR